MLAALALLARDPALVAMEVAEFNPVIDVEHRTRQLVLALLDALGSGRGVTV